MLDEGLIPFVTICELIYFYCGLVFEAHYSYPYVKPKENSNNSKGYNNTLEDRIILMHNSQLIKFFLVILALYIYGIVLYFRYSNKRECRIKLNLKKFFSYYYHIFMIIIADIVPFLFIYPFISDFTSYLCMPVHWNTGQYLIIYAIILKIFINKVSNKSLIITILFSIISFCIYVYGFSNFFHAKDSNYTNYFNNSISIVIFFFAPMILFIKEYSIQKIFINSKINLFSFIFIIWIFEEIIYLILRIYFVSFKNIFFGGIKIQNIFVTLLSVYNDIMSYFFLSLDSHLATKGLGKSFSHFLLFFLLNFKFLFESVTLGVYVLFSILASFIEIFGYGILFFIVIDKNDIIKELYKDKLPLKLIEENNNRNINISMRTINYSIDQLTNKSDTITPNKSNINYDEKIKNLRDEISLIKKNKINLEKENDSLRNNINLIKNKNNLLTQENEKLTKENEKLISELGQKETQIEQLKKEY